MARELSAEGYPGTTCLPEDSLVADHERARKAPGGWDSRGAWFHAPGREGCRLLKQGCEGHCSATSGSFGRWAWSFLTDSPLSSMQWAECTMRSQMASAIVGSPITSCHLATGSREARSVEALPWRSSRISRSASREGASRPKSSIRISSRRLRAARRGTPASAGRFPARGRSCAPRRPSPPGRPQRPQPARCSVRQATGSRPPVRRLDR